MCVIDSSEVLFKCDDFLRLIELMVISIPVYHVEITLICDVTERTVTP